VRVGEQLIRTVLQDIVQHPADEGFDWAVMARFFVSLAENRMRRKEEKIRKRGDSVKVVRLRRGEVGRQGAGQRHISAIMSGFS